MGPVAEPAKQKELADRLLHIDSMRGLAALGVFFFHCAVSAGFPKRTLPPVSFLGRTFDAIPSVTSLGATGVNLFFVISGFCLALQQRRGNRRTVDVTRYARHRFARVVPAYWVAVLVAAGTAIALGSQPDGPFVVDVLVHLGFLQFIHPSHFISLHPALWSMATEVQFYVAFPLVYALLVRVSALRFVLVLAAVNLAWRGAVALTAGAFAEVPRGVTWEALLSHEMPGRLLEFGLGMVLADVYLSGDSRPRKIAEWAVLPVAAVALYLRARGPTWLPDIAMGVLYATACCAVLRPPAQGLDRRASPLTEAAARAGRASYSFFLVHYPVLAAAEAASPFPLSQPYARFAFVVATALPASMLAAIALYNGVELPLWKRLRG